MDTVEERRGHRRAVSIAPDAHHSAGQGGDEMGGSSLGRCPSWGSMARVCGVLSLGEWICCITNKGENRRGRESALRMDRQTDRQSSQLTPVLVPWFPPSRCMVLRFLSPGQQFQSCPSPPFPHLPH